MNEIVKQSIDSRKNAIFSGYNVTDKGILNKIENLFKRINEFGEKFNDVMEFEAEFAKSPLSNEYTNIFVEIAQKEIDAAKPSMGEVVADRVGTEIKNRVIPSRAVRADARDQALRSIPVVGDIIDASQKIDLINKFRNKNND